MEIAKTYSPQDIEKKWYQWWMDNGYFTPKIDPDKKPFTILIPPPNVTGILHMGHVLNNTLQDVLVRYHRMTGAPALWLPGTDHAGIATQNVVERELAKSGQTRHDIGREELIKRIWAFKEAKGGHIIAQLKQLGCSCDWSRLRFTMDDMLSRAVKEVFVHLYEKNLIYKGKYIINWCPRCVTALANDEVEHADEHGKLWHFRYPFKDGSGYLTIATTRPETMLGDVAVAVHPDDDRYRELIGKTLILPIVNREIPVIADEYVDKSFGTGCVKVTPAHDPNDFDMGTRHALDPILVMDEHAVMNANAGAEFVGMTRFECRDRIVDKMRELGLLDRIEDHQHAVGHCYRCDTVVEPYLSEQWFVSMKPLAAPAIDVVKNGEVKIIPDRWYKVYLHWMENVRDWCISRQIWWGHRIPAYYCESCGEMVVAREMPKTCPKCGHTAFRQDNDVLDTWFSSSIWPFSTLGWPDETEDLNYFLPTNVLVTQAGILYLWVARMIMTTLEFRGKIPFDTVLLHALVLDEQGRKMSKSLGNSPDPIDIIENVGADALRFGMIFATPRGQDCYWSESMLEIGRNFANKIWNAYRFIMMNVEKIDGLPKREELRLELADRWIYSRLQHVTREVAEFHATLRHSEVAQAVMDFIWTDFCSWYLELAKDRIYNESDREGQLTTKYVLLDILQNGMRLLHPLMPFITEEIWQSLKPHFPMDEAALIIAAFPTVDENLLNEDIENEMGLIQECITAIRALRKQVEIPPSADIRVACKLASPEQKELLHTYKHYLAKLARVTEIEAETDLIRPKPAVAAVVRDVELFLPLTGLVDIDKERAKLHKQADKLAGELRGVEGKLSSTSFVENAPEAVVTREREKRADISGRLEKVQALLSDME
jgi:valyl-tRNA synthetase